MPGLTLEGSGGEETIGYSGQVHCSHTQHRHACGREAGGTGHGGMSCPGLEVEGNVSSLLLSSVLVICNHAASHPKPATWLQQPSLSSLSVGRLHQWSFLGISEAAAGRWQLGLESSEGYPGPDTRDVCVFKTRVGANFIHCSNNT